MSPEAVRDAVEQRLSPDAVNTRPLRLAMHRMRIPLRRIRQNFETRDVRSGSLYGKLWWRDTGGARIGGFFGFIPGPAGGAHLPPPLPRAGGLALVPAPRPPLHQSLRAR